MNFKNMSETILQNEIPTADGPINLRQIAFDNFWKVKYVDLPDALSERIRADVRATTALLPYYDKNNDVEFQAMAYRDIFQKILDDFEVGQDSEMRSLVDRAFTAARGYETVQHYAAKAVRSMPTPTHFTGTLQ